MADHQEVLKRRYQRTVNWLTNHKITISLRNSYERFLESQQVSLSRNIEALPQLAFLGLICGLLSASVIILFHLFMTGLASPWMPQNNLEGFELLSPLQRLL